jgi:hypothetical protein
LNDHAERPASLLGQKDPVTMNVSVTNRGITNPHLWNLIIPRGLTAQEKKDLVEYMQAVNGEGGQVTAPAEFPQ